MTTVDTSTTYQADDDALRLKLELSSLLEEVTRNNRKIHDIQIRDMQSLEQMKFHMNRKRELNERMRQLKKIILERYVERQGSMVKIDEWMSGLNIPSSPPALCIKSPEDTVSSLHRYYNDTRIGDITDTVEQNTDDLLEQLSMKIDHLTKSVNSSVQSDSLAGETRSRSENSTKAQQNDKVDNQSTFLFQHLKNPESSPPIKPSPLSAAPEQQQSTTRKRSGQVNHTHRLNYPANVELRSIKSPPVLPHRRKTYTTFTTKHNLCRKPQSPLKTSVKNKHVGDYMVHSRNPVAPSLTPFACGANPGSTKFCGIVWTVVIIVTLTALFYMYPSLLNAVLLLKEGTEQARDEVTRILDSIIVRAGGDSWLSGNLAESESYTTASPAPTPSPSLYCSWSSSLGSSSSETASPATESATESEISAWQTILDYAKAVYRYVLYDFP